MATRECKCDYERSLEMGIPGRRLCSGLSVKSDAALQHAALQQPALIKRFMVPYATVARVGRVGAGCSGTASFRKQLPLSPV